MPSPSIPACSTCWSGGGPRRRSRSAPAPTSCSCFMTPCTKPPAPEARRPKRGTVMGSFIDIDGVNAWRAEPEGEVKGGLIVIHEIWGLVGHTRDVADRFAAQGYLVYAPDLLSEAGTTPEVGEELQAIIGAMDDEVRDREQPRLRAAFAPNSNPEFGERATAKLIKVLDALERED